MWDRLLVDCQIATMQPSGNDPVALLRNAAIGIQDGKIVRVGKRTELAGFKAKEFVPLGGALVTPGACDQAPAVLRRTLKRIGRYDVETARELATAIADRG
ncbi:MAG TPA: hypothetical protein VM760_00815, partial [Sphingomicrobium sp.]|nr:hypothetical protein [Sphingomicrobium sp.]